MALSSPIFIPVKKMPVIDNIPKAVLAEDSSAPLRAQRPEVQVGKFSSADDGTRPLLKAGFWITVAGLTALAGAKTVLGGIGIDGPHTNVGWLAFMFALMGVPFGLMLLVLGVAKWLRNRHINRQ